jgi:hypothetical protein
MLKRRGRGAKVQWFIRRDELWFLVRHGDLLKREESIDGAKSSSVCFRPAKYDVLVYDRTNGDLRIYAGTKGEKNTYQSLFGRVFFGEDDHFQAKICFTLDPIRTLGPSSVNCMEIPGLESITLCEIQRVIGGEPAEIIVNRSDDLFQLYESRGADFPAGGELIRAKFRVKFSAGRSPRTVVVHPPNRAQYSRDDDAAWVEAWLLERGFIRPRGCKRDGRLDVAGVDGDRTNADSVGGDRRMAKPTRRGV